MNSSTAVGSTMDNDKLSEFYKKQLEMMFTALKPAIPGYYFGGQWDPFEVYLKMPDLTMEKQMLRYLAFFELLKATTLIVIKILSKYNNSANKSLYLEETQSVIDVEISSNRFELIKGESIKSKQQFASFHLIVDWVSLLETINAAKKVNSIALLVENADKFYTTINEKITGTNCFFNAMLVKKMEKAVDLTHFNEDAQALCMKMDVCKTRQEVIAGEKNYVAKKDAAINFFENFASVATAHLGVLALHNSQNDLIQEIRLYYMLVNTEAGFERLQNACKRLVVFNNQASYWVDFKKLYRVFGNYLCRREATEDIATITANIQSMIADAEGYIKLLNDEEKLKNEFETQELVLQNFIHALRQNVSVMMRQTGNQIQLELLRKQNPKPVVANIIPGTMPSLTKAETDILNKQAREYSVKVAAYQANQESTQKLVSSIYKINDQVSARYKEILAQASREFGVVPRKNFNKLISAVAIDDITTEVNKLNIEAKPYSPEAATILNATRSCADKLLYKLKEMLKLVDEESVYLKSAELEKLKANLKKQKKLIAAKEAEQKRLEKFKKAKIRELQENNRAAKQAQLELKACKLELERVQLEETKTVPNELVAEAVSAALPTETTLNENITETAPKAAVAEAVPQTETAEIPYKETVTETAPPPPTAAVVEAVPAPVATEATPEETVTDTVTEAPIAPTPIKAEAVAEASAVKPLPELVTGFLNPQNFQLQHLSGHQPAIEAKYLPIGVVPQAPPRRYSLFGSEWDTLLLYAHRYKASGNKLTTEQLEQINFDQLRDPPGVPLRLR